MKKYHNGYPQALHDNCIISPNIEHPEPNKYCLCGGSGGNTYTMKKKNEFIIEHQDNINTCGFYTGVSCYDKKLYRKWSCCDTIIFGTFNDLKIINGCCVQS